MKYNILIIKYKNITNFTYIKSYFTNVCSQAKVYSFTLNYINYEL